jgi:hypothetical protein
MMNWKGFEMKQLLPNRGTIPVFSPSDGGKSRRTSISIAGVSAEVRNKNLPNTSIKRRHSANPLSMANRDYNIEEYLFSVTNYLQ